MSTCEPYRNALSAMMDGELAPLGEDAVRRHLDVCAACTAFAATSEELAGRLRFAPAEAVPDLTAAILAAVDTVDVARVRARFCTLRVVLAFAGIAQLLVAVPSLVTAGAVAGHVAREVAIFELALAVGFVVAAWRPARAGGLLPVAAVVAMLVSVTSLADVTGGSTSVAQESAHLLQVVGTGLLWALDRQRGRAPLRPAVA